MSEHERESVKVLREAIELQLRKSRDYQNEKSNVTQAMHYRRGVDSIHDIIQQKVYRAQSVLESGRDPNFESLEDTYMDLINYASFAVAWLRGKVPGQDPARDAFNQKVATVPLQTGATPSILDETRFGETPEISGRWGSAQWPSLPRRDEDVDD